jgi:outer membrane protein assembly factor BamE (lipoprotein component of BamABCDE complex)
MLKKIYVLCFFFSIIGCALSIDSQIDNLKPGMTKKEVDLALQDKGKWIGPVETEEGSRAVWGYPSSSYGPNAVFNQDVLKRFYLFFDGDKYVKHTDSFTPYQSKSPSMATPAGVAGPGSFTGGRMPGGSPGDMTLEGVENPVPGSSP